MHPTSVKIPSQYFTGFPIPNPTPPSVPRGLNQSPLLVHDPPVVITDSTQSPWLPSSVPSQPAPSEHHQQPPASRQPQSFDQDFCLFPPSNNQLQPPPHNRSLSHPNTGLHRQNKINNRISTSRLPNLTPAQIRQLHLERHQRQQQLHNSAPPSVTAVNQLPQPSKSTQRPPVPLFNLPNGTMELGNSRLLHPVGAPGSQLCSDIDLPHVPFGGGALSEFSSPADPVFDNFHVSPEQLFMDVNMSAPNSEALTCLTTPSSGFDASPAYSDWNTSPLFAANDDASPWPSLFPEVTPAPVAEVEQSPVVQDEEVQPAKKPTSRKSSTSASPNTRHSSVAGVSASRRRSKPLPPIHVDDAGDEKSMKRARNTLAARKSRARRQNHIEELEQTVKELEARLEKTEQERDHYKQLYDSR